MQKIFIVLTAACFFSSCTFNTGNIDQGKKIDLNTKKEIDNLNGVVVSSIINNQPGVLISIASDSFIAVTKKSSLISFLQQTSRLVDSSTLKTIDQFDLVNSTDNATMIANGQLSGKHDYSIVFTSLTKEAAITVAEFKNGTSTMALTTIYGKYNDGWKLNYLMVKPLRYLNMDAVDWYEQSRLNYEAGDLVDAYGKLLLGTELSKPSGNNWSYLIKSEVESFGDSLQKAVTNSFTFPINQSTGPTNVSIFHVQPHVLPEGYAPCVYFVSTISQSDTLSLSKECDRLNGSIGDIFKGIDKNKTIIYLAYHQVPQSDSEYKNCYRKQITLP